MTKRSFSVLVLVLCVGLLLVGCPKKQVVVNRDRGSSQRSDESGRLEAERAAREAKEAQELRERELARMREEEAKKRSEQQEKQKRQRKLKRRKKEN